MRIVLIATLIIMMTTSNATASEKKKENPEITLETTKGKIVLRLDQKKAPIKVSNFLEYVQSGHYDGTVFHRVIKGFMIQGGGFTSDMRQKSVKDPIKNEADNGLKNERGAIAMARTPNPNSATAQFFINTVDNPFLDHKSKDMQGWGYAVFGKVVEGMEVVDSIASVKTGTKGGHQDVPIEPVVILKTTVQE